MALYHCPAVGPIVRSSRSVARHRDPVWEFLKGYRFKIRWRDPCAYTAEIHGAISAKFGGAPEVGAEDEGPSALSATDEPYVIVTAPQTELDLERFRQAVQEEVDRGTQRIIVIIVTKWFSHPVLIRSLSRELGRMGARVLVKGTPPPGPVGTTRERLTERTAPTPVKGQPTPASATSLAD